jgi:hypothetical protein
MRNPRPCVDCGMSFAWHDWYGIPAFYRPTRLRHVDHADHVRPRRPTFTTTWPREPGPLPVKVIVRNEAEEVVAVCYGTTESVTLPSDLVLGQRYTLQPIIGSLHVALPIRPHDDVSA